MKKDEKLKTVFRTYYKLFEYLIIPFRLINAPASEQELINNLFKNILNDYIITYLNDILIYLGGTLKNH